MRLFPMALAGLAVMLACATKPLHKRDWLEIRTPHFEIVSALGEEASLDPRARTETWQLALREAPFADVEAVREGIALAFERELPRTARSW